MSEFNRQIEESWSLQLVDVRSCRSKCMRSPFYDLVFDHPVSTRAGLCLSAAREIPTKYDQMRTITVEIKIPRV